MAEQLGVVVYELITAVVTEISAQRRKSRTEKMNTLKATIKESQELVDVAEKQYLKNKTAKDWLVSVKDVYYQVIDVCQELRMDETRKDETVPHYCFCFPSSKRRNEILQMTDNILQMMEGIIKIRQDVRKLCDNSKPSLPDEQTNQTFLHDHDKEIKITESRENEKRKLIPEIYHGLDKVKVVCIRGMTGIGKSALAREVYKEVKKDFGPAAMVNVSAEFDPMRIAQDFVESVTSKKMNKKQLESLPQEVSNLIKGKKFLLVLDDVREENKKALKSKWNKLMDLFKADVPGCTILMTITKLPNNVIQELSYDRELQKLPDDECWSIILEEAFGASKDSTRDNKLYTDVGEELVKKCEGLPVIAKALGVVLRDRTSFKYWKHVLDSDLWDLAPKDKPAAIKATMLSYHCLPKHLKQCLLYCSIFPKNHSIDVDQLINLWMSQDCIGLDHAENKIEAEAEAEGWSRFNQLLERSIFQDYTQQVGSGSFECKLQGAMSDFIGVLVPNECHILHLEKKKGLPDKVRHCTVNVRPQDSLPASISNSNNLHTLMVLSKYSSIDPKTLSSLLSPMRRLRALVLSYCSMKALPSKACELFHLRYLDLSFNRDLKELPEEICNLSNLQTLNLNGCDELQELPTKIGKLSKLRHLDILWTTNLSYLPKSLTELGSLKRLSRFFGGTGQASLKACNLADMKGLNKLQGHIIIEGLGGDKSGSSEAKTADLNNKKQILGLELWFSVKGKESDNDHEDVLNALEAPEKLECLGIFYYRGYSFSSWIVSLQKLKHLILSDCDKCNALPALGILPLLETLEIKNLVRVETVGGEFLGNHEENSKEVGFPELKKLCFRKLDRWEEWENQRDDRREHMPKLSYLLIDSCFKRTTLPKYIQKKLKKDYQPGENVEENVEWDQSESDQGKSKTTQPESKSEEPRQKASQTKPKTDEGTSKTAKPGSKPEEERQKTLQTKPEANEGTSKTAELESKPQEERQKTLQTKPEANEDTQKGDPPENLD